MQLEINVIPKVHAMFFHIQEICDLTDRSLGLWNEQASESLHQELNICWKKYLVKNQKSLMYKQRILQGVQMFNNLNI